uniref:Uncharacterized protein n=1 Tax=Glossina pallidipes TaxID=7398 RepID=A0A1A9ZJS6_GLOPL
MRKPFMAWLCMCSTMRMSMVILQCIRRVGRAKAASSKVHCNMLLSPVLLNLLVYYLIFISGVLHSGSCYANLAYSQAKIKHALCRPMNVDLDYLIYTACESILKSQACKEHLY